MKAAWDKQLEETQIKNIVKKQEIIMDQDWNDLSNSYSN